MTILDDKIRAKIDAFATELVAAVRRAALEAVTAAIGTAPAAAPAPAPAKRGRGRPKKVATPTPAAPTPAPAKRGRGRLKKVAAPAPAAKAPAAAKPAKAAPAPKSAAAPKAAGSKKAAPKRAPGEKRPSAELARLTERLGDYIKANPGQRMEAIGKALGTSTKDLTLPVKKLLHAKKIRVQGEKRATEYFPA